MDGQRTCKKMRGALLLGLTAGLFLFSTSAWAQIRLVNVTSCGPGIYPATVCTIPSTGSGNLIVVGYSPVHGLMPTISSVADNAGNTYAQAGNARAIDSVNQQMVDIWYAKNSKAGATRVTITPSLLGIAGAALIWEFANVDTVSPLTKTAVLNNQPATTTPLGASVTTTNPSEVIISLMVPWGPISGLRSGNPFTSDSLLYGVGWAHLITSSAGTYAAQWNASAAGYASSTVSFKGAPSGSGINACDLAAPYGTIDAADVQSAINMTLGLSACTANIVGPGVCNVVAVQRVINASLSGGTCVTDSTPTPIPHSVTLSWTASTSSGVTGYNVYRRATSTGTFTKLNSSPIASTAYTDNTVQAGQTYYYVTTAVGNTGLESTYSNQATAVVPSP